MAIIISIKKENGRILTHFFFFFFLMRSNSFLFFFLFFDKQLKRTFHWSKTTFIFITSFWIWFPITKGVSSTQTKHSSTRLAYCASKWVALLLPLLMWEAFHDLNYLRVISMPSETFLMELGVGSNPLNTFTILSESLSTMISLSPRS